MKDKSKKLINNVFIFMVGSIGSKIIQFFLVPLYTYSLTSEQYGATEVVIAACNILMPIFSMSIADGLLRFGLDKRWEKNDVLKSSLFIVCIGSLLSFILYPIFNRISFLNNWTMFFILILNLQIYRSILSIYLKINEKNKLFALEGMIYTFTLCCSSILFLTILRLGILGYFLSYIIANFVSICYLMVTGKVIKAIINAKIEKKLNKEMLQYSVPMITNGIAWWMMTASDRFVLNYFSGDSSVGIYSVADKIPSMILTLSGVFMQAWIISSVNEFDNDRDASFYSNVFSKYSLVMFLASSYLIAIIKPFMHIYVSSEFQIAWKYTPLLISSAVYSGIFGFFVGIYAAAKNSISVTITTAIGAMSNLVLNFLLIPGLGIHGAVIATCVSWLITVWIRIFDSRKILPFYINFKVLVSMMLINTFQSICVTFLDDFYSCAVSFVSILTMIIINRTGCISVLKQIKSLLCSFLKRKVNNE